jgi:hypothetical protein
MDIAFILYRYEILVREGAYKKRRVRKERIRAGYFT